MDDIDVRVFWRNVKDLRTKKGWTQPELATMVGIGYRQYNDKERCFSLSLSEELAEGIAKVLGTTVEELCKGEPLESTIDPEILRFWANAKKRREELGLSQTAIAEKLGISMQNYQTKESGKAAKLPRELAEKVAEALRTNVDELNGMTEEDPREDAARVIYSKKTEYTIGHLLESVQEFIADPKNKETVENLIVKHLMTRK